MQLGLLDIVVFALFIFIVVGTSLFKGRKENTSEDYFLAGRGLPWWLIGISLIAANISTEQFVGMAGSSAGNVGLAIASYEWMAAITLVIVAIFFLPKFLSSGIYTIPEYLEYRYNTTARSIMSVYLMVIYVVVTIAAVLYSGALAIHTIFDFPLTYGVWFIAIIATVYTTYGGLKSVAWADLFQGSALIIGGLCVTAIGFMAVGDIPAFWAKTNFKFHMILPSNHPELPWTALIIGLWIPNFYYWGLNQYIAQRTLAAKTLKQGQLGVIFAACLKLIMPLITVVPGILAYELYKEQLAIRPDEAFPLLVRNLVPVGLKGFILAALAGAVISTLASMLNSAATIFTMDIYKRHLKKDASSHSLITIGRIATITFIIIGSIIAPLLADPKFGGIFHYIQDFQGFISPGILAAFVFGLVIKRAPAAAAVTALLLNVPVYGLLHLQVFDPISFLNKMAITFGTILFAMTIITIIKPLEKPVVMPVKEGFDMKPTPQVLWLGIGVIILTLSLYVIFW